MKTINAYRSVEQIFPTSMGIAIATKKGNGPELANYLFLLSEGIPKEILDEELYYCYPFLDGFVFENRVGEGIFFSNFEKKIAIAPAGFNIPTSNQKLFEKMLLSSGKLEKKQYYFLKKDFSLTEIPVSLSYETKDAYIKNTVFDRENLYAFDKQAYNALWTVNIAKAGHRTSLSTGASIPNELGGELLSYAHLLFVPLEGGQLLALDSRTGEQVWILNDEIGGQYSIIQDKIYKKNQFIYEIEALTGEILRKKDLEDGYIKDGFVAVGPIWAFDEILVLINNYEGDVVVLNRADFSLSGVTNLHAAMAHSKDIIHWNSQRLYVHDLSNTLHVFELE